MNHLIRWASNCLLLLLISAGVGRAEIPTWIPAPAEKGPSPIWVSAAEVTTPDGKLRSEMFSSIEQMRLKQYLERQEEARERSGTATRKAELACRAWIFIPPRPVVEELTLEGLLEHAELAFVGTVQDQEEGFYHGHPNSLLEIEVEEVFEAAPGYEGISSLYSTFPHVEMKVAKELVCMRSDRYPARPITGKGIMIFTANIPDRDPLVVAPNTEVIFFEDADGNAVLPARFGDVIDPPSWSSLVQQARDVAAEVRKGGGSK